MVNQIIQYQPDLLLLDVNLPIDNGYTICRQIRKDSQMPIIFVTSQTTSMDELKALSLGRDDFISKPYNIPILLARINRLLKRTSTTQDDILTLKD